MLHNYNVTVNYFSCDKLMTELTLFVLQGAFMSWDARWKILSDVIVELYKRGGRVPQNVINDLRSAKVMIEVVKADRTRAESIARLEELLSNVESYVLSAARDMFGEEYIDNILRKLCELETEGFILEEPTRFRPGLPRGERWVRIQVSEITPLEFIEETASELNLKFRVEEDGYVLVYGAEEKLKAFVRKLSERTRALRESHSSI
ncbi:MAG: DUF2096 family protein [Candidatus Bathyarchaeia archaeon]